MPGSTLRWIIIGVLKPYGQIRGDFLLHSNWSSWNPSLAAIEVNTHWIFSAGILAIESFSEKYTKVCFRSAESAEFGQSPPFSSLYVVFYLVVGFFWSSCSASLAFEAHRPRQVNSYKSRSGTLLFCCDFFYCIASVLFSDFFCCCYNFMIHFFRYILHVSLGQDLWSIFFSNVNYWFGLLHIAETIYLVTIVQFWMKKKIENYSYVRNPPK